MKTLIQKKSLIIYNENVTINFRTFIYTNISNNFFFLDCYFDNQGVTDLSGLPNNEIACGL